MDFLQPFSFLVVIGVGVAAGVGGVSAVNASNSSSGRSLPLRFLPCRRHGSNGVDRTRTSQENLFDENSNQL